MRHLVTGDMVKDEPDSGLMPHWVGTHCAHCQAPVDGADPYGYGTVSGSCPRVAAVARIRWFLRCHYHDLRWWAWSHRHRAMKRLRGGLAR